jgi:iron complex outermembrane receptor protein
VLKDGASSTYGADAVAGVINIIIKKEIKGFHADVSSGISQQGDAAERRGSLTYGYGDLAERGFNVYVNAEYQKNDALYNRDRGFPYNTSDLSSLCGTSITDGSRTCRTNNVINGIQADGSFLTPGNPTFATTVPVVRPLDANGMPVGAFQLLNPAAGCGSLRPVTLTPEQQNTDPANPFAAQQCQLDPVAKYGVISPSRNALAPQFTSRVQTGDSSKAYALFT